MASELAISTAPDATVYALVRNASNQIWNGTTFVTYATVDYATYDVAMAEQGTSSGYYVGDFPSSAASGQYTVTFKVQAGGSPAESDDEIVTNVYNWNSTSTDITTTAPAGEEYCTDADVAARLSQWGLDLRVNDAPTMVNDCIENASSDIDLRLLPVYSAADIAESRWVHFACRALSVYYVCLRRNEPVPASVQEEYEKTMAELAAIADGTLTLPGAAKSTSGIQVSNQNFDNMLYPALRVNRARSTPSGQLPRRNTANEPYRR